MDPAIIAPHISKPRRETGFWINIIGICVFAVAFASIFVLTFHELDAHRTEIRVLKEQVHAMQLSSQAGSAPAVGVDGGGG